MSRVRDPSTWPQWQSEILATDGSEEVEPGDVVQGDARLLGFDVTGHSSILRASADVLEEEVVVGVRMRVTYSVTPAPGGSVITHRIEADLPTGLAGSLLSLLLRLRLRKMQRSLLAALSEQARRGQAGDEPV